jgi:glycerophosphoryl diester phosphodiesterase
MKLLPLLQRVLAPALAGLALAGTAQAIDLQGHRGTRGLAPENSLPSFEMAILQGVTTLETDAAVTRDGVVVLHHDLALNPDHTRDARGEWLKGPQPPIHTMSLAELKAYDIGRIKPGSRYAEQFPDQKPVDGTPVPRLSELFDMVKAKGYGKVRFAIEIKSNPEWPEATLAPEPFARALVDEVRRHGMAPRVQIMSFDWRNLQAVQRIAPEIPTVYLTAQQTWMDNIRADQAQPSPWTAGVQHRDHGSVPAMIKAAGGRYWSVFHRDLSPALLAEAHRLGIKVLVWTINDAPTMGKLVDMGVDGLITDRGDIARQVLADRRVPID